MATILIIEDQPDVRENIEAILELEDYQTLTAADGVIGVQLAQQYLPDLILCDVMMPRLDGFGVLQTLREQPTTQSIPLIFLTAKADKEAVRQGMGLGADDYLVKPFTLNELLEAIKVRLTKHQALQSQHQEKLHQLQEKISRTLPHELLTPLNGILGLSEVAIAAYESFSPTEMLDLLKDIHQSGERLHHLIQQFLLFSQLQLLTENPERLKAWQQYRQETLETLPIIQTQAAAIATQYQRLDDLHLKLSPGELQITPDDWQTILGELLDNAFKFSEPGTPVTVTTQRLDSQFRLTLQDQGRGMTPQQIQAIGAYQQFDRPQQEQQGAGLGLAIAQKMTELYGGQCVIESTPQGTQLTLTWPLPPKSP